MDARTTKEGQMDVMSIYDTANTVIGDDLNWKAYQWDTAIRLTTNTAYAGPLPGERNAPKPYQVSDFEDGTVRGDAEHLLRRLRDAGIGVDIDDPSGDPAGVLAAYGEVELCPMRNET